MDFWSDICFFGNSIYFLDKIIMISLEEYKKALGPYVEELSEEEILRAREIQDKMAEILFYDWLENLNKKDI